MSLKYDPHTQVEVSRVSSSAKGVVKVSLSLTRSLALSPTLSLSPSLSLSGTDASFFGKQNGL